MVSVLALLCAFVALPANPPPAARPWPCLPPAFEGGRRLHPRPTPEVFWLEIMLRQHELCWRSPATPGELRVALFGSSAVYGFPLPVEETLGGLLNDRFAAEGIPAHLFNLGFVTPYQIRDAVLIHEALAYDPDIIVYPMTLAEFRHIAPMPFPTYTRYFNMNHAALRRLTEAPPAGLEEPFANYAADFARTAPQRDVTDQLRDMGLYARRVARAGAEAIAARLNSPRPPFEPTLVGRQTQYDCAKTRMTIAAEYRDWKSWSILPYLEELQRTRGIRVLVVHWPVALEPIEDCYSVRYTKAAVADFAQWLRAETEQRHLDYLDLRELLPPELFIDSIHITAEGHRRIAEHVAGVLNPMIGDLSTQRAARASSPSR